MKKQIIWRRLGIVLVLLLTMAALAPNVLAFESRGGQTVVIGADEVVADDLYVTGGTVTLDGTVQGDLVASGATITINGTVEGDLMAAGQTVIINGAVNDDVRIAGAVLTVGSGARIADDLVGAGWSLETETGSVIGGDLVFAGQQVLLAGEVTGDADVSAGAVQITGTVGGNVDAEVGGPSDAPPISPFMFMPGVPAAPAVPGGLTVEDATIGGVLRYTSPQPVPLPEGVASEYRPTPQRPEEEEQAAPAQSPVVTWLLSFLRTFVALLLVGLLLVWLAPKPTLSWVNTLAAKPLPVLGWGIVVLVAFLFLMPLLLMVVIGLAALFGFLTLGSVSGLVLLLGVLTLLALTVAFIFVWSWLSRILVGLWLGRLILQRVKPDWADHRIWPLVLGVFLFALIGTIPILGGLLGLVVSLLGLGAIFLWWRQRRTPAAAGVALEPVEVQSGAVTEL